jgi:hypothetical protein
MADATNPVVLRTIQSNIKSLNKDMTQYSLFLGGLDVTNGALQQYDPLRTGYGRIFVVRRPMFLESIFDVATDNSENKKKLDNFFHMLEYGFLSVDGIQNTTMEFESITGGYAGRSFEIPTLSKDDTNSITMRVYEMAGSPIREVIDTWITGIADPYTGLTHYHGALDKLSKAADSTIPVVGQYYHTAEMIYVATDSTGRSTNIEYACLLCNMVPKIVKKDHFNYEAGTHNLVQYDIEFTATKYESIQINAVAAELLKKQTILADYTYFQDKNLGTYNYKNNTLDTTKGSLATRKNPTIKNWATETPEALTK